MIWDRSTFEAMASAIGASRADDIIRRFGVDLATRLVDRNDDAVVRRDAHVMVSVAGMLGFVDLANAVKVLEAACGKEYGIEAAFASAVAAKDAARDLIKGEFAICTDPGSPEVRRV